MQTSKLINGYLLDINEIWDWYNHKTFGAHTPYQTIKTIELLLQKDLPEFEFLIYHLSLLNNYGFWIPDCVFKNMHPPYKRYGQIVSQLHEDLIKMMVSDYYVIR